MIFSVASDFRAVSEVGWKVKLIQVHFGRGGGAGWPSVSLEME